MRPSSRTYHPRCEVLEERTLMAALDLGLSPPAPVAALADDVYEQNDTRTTAKDLGAIHSNRTIGNLVQADANDWYRFSIGAKGTSNDKVAITFQHAKGDLDMQLYDARGQLVRTSSGVANVEQVSLNSLAAGTYYVRVYGYRGTTNPNYALNFTVKATATTSPAKPTTPTTPVVGAAPVVVTDDAYENNDTRATARNLGTLTSIRNVPNLVLADSQDWFRFTTTGKGASAASVRIGFQHSQGNLTLELYNSNGQRIAVSSGSSNSEVISLAGRAAGTYYVRVSGAMNPHYTLQINPAAVTSSTPGSYVPAPTQPTSSGVSGSTGSTTNSRAFDIQFAFSGLTASQRAIFEQAAGKWEAIIVGDLPNATYNGRIIDDLMINASSVAIDGPGRILGQASPDRFRSGSLLPYHGTMSFDTADLAQMQADGTLLNVIIHEIGHVLGIGTLWASKNLLVGGGTSNPLYVGPQALAQYNALFGQSAAGIPVESGGGAGTRDAHWSEAVFANESLTGYVDQGANPISRITIGALADLGYRVNLAAADAYARPRAASYYAASSPTRSTGSTASLQADPRQEAEAAAACQPAAPRFMAAPFELAAADMASSFAELAGSITGGRATWETSVDHLFAEALEW